MSELRMIESNYFDKLQTPLQPTKDNLEMYTYLAFEKVILSKLNHKNSILSKN